MIRCPNSANPSPPRTNCHNSSSPPMQPTSDVFSNSNLCSFSKTLQRSSKRHPLLTKWWSASSISINSNKTCRLSWVRRISCQKTAPKTLAISQWPQLSKTHSCLISLKAQRQRLAQLFLTKKAKRLQIITSMRNREIITLEVMSKTLLAMTWIWIRMVSAQMVPKGALFWATKMAALCLTQKTQVKTLKCP